MHYRYHKMADKIINGYHITENEALSLLNAETPEDIFTYMSAANRIRSFYKKTIVELCAIINAKSGNCSENCSFCNQSAHHNTDVVQYEMISSDKIVNQFEQLKTQNATSIGIVTSGKGLINPKDIETVCTAFEKLRDCSPVCRCASFGILPKKILLKLKKAGLHKYHHNLETAESFFHNICTTHTYQERADTIKTAKSIGLKVCSGALFGLGESPKQRVELAFALRDLNVDKVPLNFLNPIKGTPAENNKPLSPLEIFKIISLFRFVLPDKDIGVCGGREINLRGLQPLIYIAGANAVMVGNYLTTSGRNTAEDLQDIKDLGLAPLELADYSFLLSKN
ncbi:biotin synthase BioB [bacterium]|nr:biotin synthase BioB [bacterium]